MQASLFLLAGLFSVSTWAAPLPSASVKKVDLSSSALKFEYESHDGSWKHPCKPTQIYEGNPYDYTVKCYQGEEVVRTFNVHLALTVYQRTGIPRTSIEILYWVNGEGATSWVHLDERSRMSDFESSQSVTGEASSLRMKVKLP